MYCHKCGNEIKKGDKFCDKCGESVAGEEKVSRETRHGALVTNDKWWQRLLKVVYIFLWLQILWIIPAVWSVNSSEYVGYYGGEYKYQDTYGAAFWYSILAIIIFVIVIRLVKITVLYIALGQKPEWKKQFKRLF